jgi:hypothetical protein
MTAYVAKLLTDWLNDRLPVQIIDWLNDRLPV